MKNKIFTFGVLTYNQETVIKTTLNSIKYQVEKYGNEYECNLIIVDDCSQDATADVCKKWIEQNGKKFLTVEFKINDKNVGTVINYNYILNKIGDSPFKIIAGDDLISHNNIIESAEKLGKHTFFSGLKLMFRESELITEKGAAYQQFYLSHIKLSKKKNLKLLKLGFVISTPQTLYSKELYEISGAANYNSSFRLFEDNPAWYAMLKNVEDIEVDYATYPIVLYRLSDNSVSNSVSEVNSIFQKELNQLYDIYIKEGNLFDRIYLKSLQRGRTDWLNFSMYVKRWFYLKCKLYAIIHKSEFQNYYRSLKELYKIERIHLKNLLEISEENKTEKRLNYEIKRKEM